MSLDYFSMIYQHWFEKWLGVDLASSHFSNQWWWRPLLHSRSIWGKDVYESAHAAWRITRRKQTHIIFQSKFVVLFIVMHWWTKRRLHIHKLTDKEQITEDISFEWSIMQHGCALSSMELPPWIMAISILHSKFILKYSSYMNDLFLLGLHIDIQYHRKKRFLDINMIIDFMALRIDDFEVYLWPHSN